MDVKKLKETFINEGIFVYSPQVHHLVPSYSVYKKWIESNESEDLNKYYSQFKSSKEFFYAVFHELSHPPICPICGEFRSYNKIKSIYHKSCGNSHCVVAVHENTMFEKYGVKHTFDREETKEKIKKTFNEKWGVDNPGQSKEIRNKKENTNLKKYGGASPFCDKNIQKKIQSANFLKYGGPSPFCSEEIQIKADCTMIKKYGVKNALQSKKFFQKASRVRYFYKEENYDSSWEIAYKIYTEEVLNQRVFRNLDKKFDLGNSEFIYIPDFFNESLNQYVEVKGSQFFDENGHLIVLYKGKNKEKEQELERKVKLKEECILNNNILLLSKDQIQPMLNYVKDKYGKDYIRSFRINS